VDQAQEMLRYQKTVLYVDWQDVLKYSDYELDSSILTEYIRLEDSLRKAL